MQSAGTKCDQTCADGTACGGMKGAISGYTTVAYDTTGLTIDVKDLAGNNLDAGTGAKTRLGAVSHLNLGESKCS